MTDTVEVYSVATVWNEAAGKNVEVETQIYSGPGKIQTFEAYERTPTSGGHQFTVMRPHVHLPADTAGVKVGHRVRVTGSALSPTLAGSQYTIAGVSDKSHATALRFPVEEVLS